MGEIRIESRTGVTRCPYCLEDVDEDGSDRVRCAGCSAPLHAECLAELGSCAACGAEGGQSNATVPASWIAPPAAVRSRCAQRHVKARRQQGARRSGLCVGCHEAWLAACRDGTVASVLEDVRQRREGRSGWRSRAERAKSAGVERRSVSERWRRREARFDPWGWFGASVAAVAALAALTRVVPPLIGWTLFYVSLGVFFAERGRRALRRPDLEVEFGPRVLAKVFGGRADEASDEEGSGGGDAEPPSPPLQIRILRASEPPPSEEPDA